MKKKMAAVICNVVLLLGSVPVSYAFVSSYQPQVKSYDGISYLSGGIGVEEREALRTMAKDDNLKLSFALNQGNYLGGTNVVIKNDKGKTVLKALSNGPWFFAKLPAGTYTVMATAMGKTSRQVVHIEPKGQTQVYFTWKGADHEIATHSQAKKVNRDSQRS